MLITWLALHIVLSFAHSDSPGFFLQVGKHGIIIEFTDPDYSTRRSATYLPEVAANEGNLCSPIALFYIWTFVK